MKYTVLCCCLMLTVFTSQASSFSQYSEEELMTMLVKEFHPYPLYGDKVWAIIPDSIRNPYIAEAEKYMNNKWESLPATYFMDFKKTGNRDRYQSVYFSKRDRLTSLAMGELLEGKGRFILPLIDGLLSTCEETWWGLPAHYSTALPCSDNQEVDLFAAQTAGDLAMIQYVFRQVIDSISPLLNKRITQELERRMLLPCRKQDFGWKTDTSNWNPWITSLWIATALLAEDDMPLRAKDIALALQTMNYYYSHYRDDGGCDEGPGYWASSCGSFFNCNYLLFKATDGKLDIRNDPKFHRMGEFICRVYMGRNNHFVNFADASPYTKLNPGLVYEYGKFINSSLMKNFGVLKAHEAVRKNEKISAGKGASFHGFLYTLLSAEEMWQQPAAQPFTRDYLFPELQVFTTRTFENSDAGLSFAMKGGHNGENHNHNDVGNYIVFADGEQLLIDVGAMTYDARYFTGERYSFWAVNSDFHNTPVVNGFIQKEGRQYAARNTKLRGEKNAGTFMLDIAGAYPPEAAVGSWIRSVTLHRNKGAISFREAYKLQSYKAPSSIILMTTAMVETLRLGTLMLELNGKRYALTFNPEELAASVEKVKNEDKLVQSRWGDIYRIKLQILSKKLEGNVTYSLMLHL